LELASHRHELLESFDMLAYGVGAFAAGVIGYWSIAVLLNMTRSRQLSVFGYYCVAVGVLALFLAAR
jgi:undecaprenyl pyrophosphate phosphatase UppP